MTQIDKHTPAEALWAKNPDEIFVKRHEVIDKVRRILTTNKPWYVPFDQMIQGTKFWDDPISWKEWFSIDVDNLDISYEITRDSIVIEHGEQSEASKNWIKLAVGQVNMVLLLTQRESNAKVMTLLSGSWDSDKIVIKEASELVE